MAFVSLPQPLLREIETTARRIARRPAVHTLPDLVRSPSNRLAPASLPQALLLFFPQPLLGTLKMECDASMADLLAACPGQSLATKGAQLCRSAQLKSFAFQLGCWLGFD